MNSHSPIAVFDSGVGSYSIVRVLQKEIPKEKLIYLADRASFPYGGKTHIELKNIIFNTIKWLENTYSPKIIIIASNTPSIQVLGEIKSFVKTKLVGVFPPIKEASVISKSKHIAILATKGAVQSNEINDFIQSKQLSKNIVIHKTNASDLVALVETGTFQSDPQKTKEVIHSIIDPLLAEDKDIDVMTLSSTHLPFLKDYLVRLFPYITFLDPAGVVYDETKKFLQENNLLNDEEGSVDVLATIDKEGTLKPEGLQTIFNNLGLKSAVKVIKI